MGEVWVWKVGERRKISLWGKTPLGRGQKTDKPRGLGKEGKKKRTLRQSIESLGTETITIKNKRDTPRERWV